MTFDIESYNVNGDKLTITREELYKKFKEYRNLGYANYNVDPYLSSTCHAKADVFMSLLDLFGDDVIWEEE